MRPPLTRAISPKDFRDFYWLKKELLDFCKSCELSTSGSKNELSLRIFHFLKTGNGEDSLTRTITKKIDPPSNPTLDTVIQEHLKCSESLRSFFVSIIGPQFTFTVSFQKFLRQNIGKTYKDAMDFWHQERNQKKNSASRSVIAPQFQYNQFIRDFFANQLNQSKNRKDAIEAWRKYRAERHERQDMD